MTAGAAKVSPPCASSSSCAALAANGTPLGCQTRSALREERRATVFDMLQPRNHVCLVVCCCSRVRLRTQGACRRSACNIVSVPVTSGSRGAWERVRGSGLECAAAGPAPHGLNFGARIRGEEAGVRGSWREIGESGRRAPTFASRCRSCEHDEVRHSGDDSVHANAGVGGFRDARHKAASPVGAVYVQHGPCRARGHVRRRRRPRAA